MAIWNDKLRELRANNGMTLAYVGEQVGVTESMAKRHEMIENGTKSIPYDTICKYADLYNCSPSYIMGWDEDKIKSDSIMAANYIKADSQQEKFLKRMLEYSKILDNGNQELLLQLAENLSNKKET